MKLRRLKKGFTLVELLVVIAILAVLAGVSVVAYFGFTSQARQSADEQAVTQMNVALQAQEAIEKPADVEEAKDVLEDAGFAVEDYVPLEKQNIFYYDQQSNRVLIFDQEESKVTYPQEMADKYSDTSEKVGYWFLLNDKTYEWVGFAPSDTSDISKASEELATAIEGLGETELLKLNADIAVNEDFAAASDSSIMENSPSFTGFHYYAPSNETKDVHIDLNGHTLTFNYELNFGGYGYVDGEENGGYESESFTFSNGKIVAEYSANAVNGEKLDDDTTAASLPQIIVGEHANVTFNDCEYIFETNGNGSEFNLFSVNDYGRLTLSNCIIDGSSGKTTGVLLYGVESETNIYDSTLTSKYYGITSNAGAGLSDALKLKVDNSTITGTGGPGILVNVPGEYNVVDSTIKGDGNSVVIRGGNATFTNCKIWEDGTNLGNKSMVGYDEFSLKTDSGKPFPFGLWESGNTLQSGGLVIGDWSPNSYTYDASCKIVNTEVHMDDAWTGLPIVYLSQDGNCTTTFEYDDACKFYKDGQAYAGEGQAYLVNSVSSRDYTDNSGKHTITRGNIKVIANGEQVLSLAAVSAE